MSEFNRLLRRPLFAWLVLWLLAVGAAVWLIKPTHSFEECIHTRKAEKGYEALHKDGEALFRVGERSRLVITCGLEVVEKHDGLVTAIFTVVLTISTVFLWLATKRLADLASTQSEDMQASIREAARAATAMEGVSTGILQSVEINKFVLEIQKKFWSTQMRSYVSVLIGGATYQERDKKLRFDARPVLKNTGLTPAHDVTYRISVDILPTPIPGDFRFPIPRIGKSAGGSILAPQHLTEMAAVVSDFVDDEEVEAIKNAVGKALYVWGYLRYKDVFGKRHTTTFAQQLFWMGSDKGEIIKGWYLPRHNRSD